MVLIQAFVFSLLVLVFSQSAGTITLERTQCDGTCPAYSVTLYSNGLVHFLATYPNQLDTTFKVKRSTIHSLDEQIRVSKIFEIEPNSDGMEHNGLSVTSITIQNGNSVRSVNDENRLQWKSLHFIATQIDRAVGVSDLLRK